MWEGKLLKFKPKKGGSKNTKKSNKGKNKQYR